MEVHMLLNYISTAFGAKGHWLKSHTENFTKTLAKRQAFWFSFYFQFHHGRNKLNKNF